MRCWFLDTAQQLLKVRASHVHHRDRQPVQVRENSRHHHSRTRARHARRRWGGLRPCWFLPQEENITVAGDADNFAGKQVAGPFTAFAQAEIIDKHALAGSNGLTYAELGDLQREASAKVEELAGQGLGEGDAEYDAAAAELAEISQQRTTVMNGSFLRASLFTSVVSFGVSVLVMGTGVLFAIVGFALVKLSSGPNVVTETAPKPTASA